MSNVPTRPDVVKAFLSLQIDIPEGATPEQFIAVVRALMDRYGGADPARALQGLEVRPVQAGGVPCEWLVPPDADPARRIVFLHGGAWIGGGLPVYRLVAAVLARASGRAVLAVDYRLAPENPYPAPLDDCVAAYRYALSNGPDGPGAASVCVAGDSAGGNLTAAVTLRALDEGFQAPERIAILCGVLDLSQTDYVARHDPLSGKDSLEASYGLYTQGRIPPTHPHVSAIEAPSATLARFPPTLLQVSADEFLLEGSRRFAAKLIEGGNRTVLSVWPEMPHSWQTFLDTLPEAGAALEEVASFFTRRMA